MTATLAALGAIFHAFPALCPCELRLSRGEMQAVVALVPTLGCSRPLPLSLLPLASALSAIIYRDMSLCSTSENGPYIRTRLVTPQESNKHTGSTTPTDAFAARSCLDERPPARRESAGQFTLVCTHAHAPMSRSGAETAQGGAPLTPL